MHNKLDCAGQNSFKRDKQVSRKIREKIKTEKCFVPVVDLKKASLHHLAFFIRKWVSVTPGLGILFKEKTMTHSV